MGCVSKCFALYRCVSVNNLQHHFENFETNVSHFLQKYALSLCPNSVCNENEEGGASSYASFFYDDCKIETVVTNSYEQNDSCGFDDFIFRQSTLFYQQYIT